MRSAKELRRASIALSLFSVVLFTACIPNLEGPQCTDSRDVVREFYSWYMGTDSDVRQKQSDVYKRFIASDFQSAASSDEDAFYLAGTTPTTFKIGKCEMRDDTHVVVQVQLYWRQEGKTDQKEVYADVVKRDDKWLISKVNAR